MYRQHGEWLSMELQPGSGGQTSQRGPWCLRLSLGPFVILAPWDEHGRKARCHPPQSGTPVA
jgi:hypothetical protein